MTHSIEAILPWLAGRESQRLMPLSPGVLSGLPPANMLTDKNFRRLPNVASVSRLDPQRTFDKRAATHNEGLEMFVFPDLFLLRPGVWPVSTPSGRF